MKKVVIVGDSVASRSFVSILFRSALASKIESVTVLERSNLGTEDVYLHNLCTGLWSPAIKVINESMNIKLEPFLHSASLIAESGYRDINGHWLAKSSLRTTVSGLPILSFVRNDRLLAMLDSSIQEGLQSRHASNRIKYQVFPSAEVHNIIISQERVDIKTNTGQNFGADLIIAADGGSSKVKELLYPSQRFLSYRKYRVYRGIARKSSLPSTVLPQLAFQTWSAGSRFASVPLKHDGLPEEDACAWFAAVTAPASSNPLSIGPLLNGASNISRKDYERLSLHFTSHHFPVQSLIAATPPANVYVSDAYASAHCSKEGMSKILFTGKSGQEVPVLFLGDSNHTLDPILAQGASRAIEDAKFLCDAMERYYDKDNCQMLNEYHKNSYHRNVKLQRLSDFAQAIGHIDYELLCKVRDSILLYLPTFMKTAAFNQIIRYAST